MYNISNDFDLARLHEAIIQQICFGKNSISLLFEKIGYITIEGRFSLSDDKGNKKDFVVYPVDNDFGLLKLIEQKIDKASTNDIRSDLILTFDNGLVLMLIGDENYESYLIKIDNDEVRV